MPITQVINTLPPAPNSVTDDSPTFSSKADASLAAQVTMVTEINAFATQANALETNVNSKEASATTSKNAAATSETNAATSATNAAVSAAAAAASYDSFDDRYLGAKATAPTLDNDGNALLVGALYWNTATSLLYLWTGSVWLASGSDPIAIQNQSYIAGTTGGTSTAYTLTPSPAITAYAANQSFFITFNAVCGASPTLQISGLASPPNLVKQNRDGTYSNLGAGDITLNHRSKVTLLSATQAWVETLPITAGLGGFQAVYDYSTAGQTITAVRGNSVIALSGTASTITLPLLSSILPGTALLITGSLVCAVSRQGADVIFISSAAASATSVTVADGGATLFVAGNGQWFATDIHPLGVSQTWQAPVRALATTYTNTTGRPIAVSVYWSAAAAVQGILTVNGAPADNASNNSAGGFSTSRAIVPPGGTYSLAVTGGTIGQWLELR